MAKFDYSLALDLPREIVKAHIASISRVSLSQAQARLRKNNNDSVLALIGELRKELKVEAITASVSSKNTENV